MRTIGLIFLIILFFNVKLGLFASQPFFTTGISLTEKGEILLTQKGTKQIDIFSGDGKILLRSFTLNETPTGICTDGSKIYVTTFETNNMGFH